DRPAGAHAEGRDVSPRALEPQAWSSYAFERIVEGAGFSGIAVVGLLRSARSDQARARRGPAGTLGLDAVRGPFHASYRLPLERELWGKSAYHLAVRWDITDQQPVEVALR